MTTIYCARWVLPVISPVLEDGAVAIEDSRIVGIGPRTEILSRFPGARARDFGKAAILPGLINAHSHLELTVMRGFLENEERDFFAWLRRLTLARMAMTPEDLRVSATCGAIEAARAGVTCVGDSSSAATQAMLALREVGLRGIVYQESFGPDARLADENVEMLKLQIGAMRGFETDLVRGGVSPHALYTVSAPQLELISRLAIDDQLPLMMHAAESEAEKLFMLEGRGPFAEGLKKRGIDWQAPGISTIEYLARHGVMDTKPLLAHCVEVDDHDLHLIKRSGAGIAHCPKSNAKLGHGRAPFAKFLATEVNVGLGSDSVASNNACDILEEARFATLLARLDSRISAEQTLFAATLGGARALGLHNQIGALKEGMQADIIVVSLNGAHQQPVDSPIDALIFSSSGRDILLTVVAGKEIYSNRSIDNEKQNENQIRLEEVRRRLDDAASPQTNP